MGKKKHDPPKETAGDAAHTLARAVVSSIPVAGGAALELFQTIIAPPLQKRQAEWREAVAEGLRKLESDTLRLEDLSGNEQFIDTVLNASQAALRTSQQVKREALRNAVLNSALPHAPDESRQQIFVNLVDTLTTWHIRILRLFANPTGWFREQGKQAPEYYMSSSLSQLLCDAYPELKNERALYDQIASDLHNRGLLSVDGLHTMMSGSGAYAERATDLGKQFLKFITSPLPD